MTWLLIFLVYGLALSIALGRAGYRGAVDSSTGESLSPPKSILVIGATGGTGRELVSQALERGLQVTALARDPTRLQIDHPNLSVVQGDVLDAPSIQAAMRGQDAVISALGHKRFFMPTRILSGGTGNVLAAMDTHGVKRFVCETSLGIGSSAGRMGLYYTFFVIPVILPFYFWDKTRQERIISQSNAEWTLVRPGALTDGEGRRVYREGPKIGSLLTTVRISRSDVASFMLNQLFTDTWRRAAPGVCW